MPRFCGRRCSSIYLVIYLVQPYQEEILIRPRTKWILIREQVHPVISKCMKSSFERVHTAGVDDSLIKLVPAVNHSLREEVQPYISICAMSC